MTAKKKMIDPSATHDKVQGLARIAFANILAQADAASPMIVYHRISSPRLGKTHGR